MSYSHGTHARGPDGRYDSQKVERSTKCLSCGKPQLAWHCLDCRERLSVEERERQIEAARQEVSE